MLFKPKTSTVTMRRIHVAPTGGPAVHKNPVPLAAKVAYTLFVLVLIPVYLHEYGPTNFLWFCDAALLVAWVGTWLESSLLISACAVGILVPQCLWLADFGSRLLGFHVMGLTDYMFDAKIPLFIRGLSLFHGWLPLALVWLLGRLGYDKRGLPAWTFLASVLVMICYFFTPPPGAQLAYPNQPININYVFGINDKAPQHLIDQRLYVVLLVAALWAGAYLPTHLILRKVFRPAMAGGGNAGQGVARV
jgi:hypothetical protein